MHFFCQKGFKFQKSSVFVKIFDDDFCLAVIKSAHPTPCYLVCTEKNCQKISVIDLFFNFNYRSVGSKPPRKILIFLKILDLGDKVCTLYTVSIFADTWHILIWSAHVLFGIVYMLTTIFICWDLKIYLGRSFSFFYFLGSVK